MKEKKKNRLTCNWFEINGFFVVYLLVCVFLKRKGKIYSVPIPRIYHKEGHCELPQERHARKRVIHVSKQENKGNHPFK